MPQVVSTVAAAGGGGGGGGWSPFAVPSNVGTGKFGGVADGFLLTSEGVGDGGWSLTSGEAGELAQLLEGDDFSLSATSFSLRDPSFLIDDSWLLIWNSGPSSLKINLIGIVA